MISKKEATTLAALLNTMRPDWHPSSIVKMIEQRKEECEFTDLCQAAVKVAANPAARTPGMIFLDRSAWPTKDLSPWSKEAHRELTTSERRIATNIRALGSYEPTHYADPFEQRAAQVIEKDRP